MMVLDTDVFIDHVRGQEAASAYIHSLPADQRATTDITVMELYKGAANQQELVTILRFLTHNRVTRLPVSTTASQRAVELVHQYGLAHGLGIPDALIAAMTLEGAHTLVTDHVAALSVHCRLTRPAGAIPPIPTLLPHIGLPGFQAAIVRKPLLASYRLSFRYLQRCYGGFSQKRCVARQGQRGANP